MINIPVTRVPSRSIDPEEYWEVTSERNFYRMIVEAVRGLLIAKRPDLAVLELGLAIGQLIAENKRYAEQLVALTQPQEK